MGKIENTKKEKAPQKVRAFLLFLLKLALYARRDSNPQLLAPEAKNIIIIESYCLLAYHPYELFIS